MTDPNEIPNKIIQTLKERGPSLPIQISREIQINSLFISAFLSELANKKSIKVSNLKVGGSPLYFLEGQEKELEKYYTHLHPKEAEAFLLLKNNKLLQDSKQEPSIRVALRAIKDFAVPISRGDELFWRYFLTENPEKAIQEIFHEKELEKKETPPQQKDKEFIQKEKTTKPEKNTELTNFKNPLIIKESKREKPKSEFVNQIITYLSEDYTILEEKYHKPKEYCCIINIKSDLGTIKFLTLAKDKKTISESDIKKLLSESQSIPLPALLVYTEKLSKKVEEYLEKYSSILKSKKFKKYQNNNI